MTAHQPDETREYRVAGMTCSHCVLSVREEVSELPGVSAVDVELASGRLTVTGAGVQDDAVRAAVAEAGYEVIWDTPRWKRTRKPLTSTPPTTTAGRAMAVTVAMSVTSCRRPGGR